MAGELVRVRVHAAGREEVVRVSREHVEDYLKQHPGAVVLDHDWQPQAAPKAKAD